MKRFFLILLLMSVGASMDAQTTISGMLRNYPNQQLFIFKNLDEVSNRRSEVANVRLDDEGKFKINVEFEEVEKLYLIIKNVEGVFYAHPNRQYNLLTFPSAKESEFQKFDRTEVDLVWDKLPIDDCNALIPQFNSDLLAFLDEHFYDFAVEQYQGSEAYKAKLRGSRGNDLAPLNTKSDTLKSEVKGGAFINWVDRFREESTLKFEHGFTNKFFSDYYRYSIAELELMSGRSRKALYEEYFMSQKVQVTHPAYMKFFLAYYNHVLEAKGEFAKAEILRIVNAEQDPSKLVTLLMNDSLFLSQNVGQLAVLNGLRTLMGNPNFSKVAIRNCMRRMQEMDSCNMYKDVAANIEYKLDKGNAGYQIPSLELLNTKLDRLNLDDEIQGYTYIFFFAEWCTSCKKELLMMQKLQEQYGTDIAFIAISVDESLEQMKAYIQQNRKQDFNFLYAGNSILLREAFDLRAIPQAVLVDADGRYMYNYTRKPSEGINLDFDKIVKLLHQPKDSGTWQGK